MVLYEDIQEYMVYPFCRQERDGVIKEIKEQQDEQEVSE
jgi:hypothetical protein